MKILRSKNGLSTSSLRYLRAFREMIFEKMLRVAQRLGSILCPRGERGGSYYSRPSEEGRGDQSKFEARIILNFNHIISF